MIAITAKTVDYKHFLYLFYHYNSYECLQNNRAMWFDHEGFIEGCAIFAQLATNIDLLFIWSGYKSKGKIDHCLEMKSKTIQNIKGCCEFAQIGLVFSIPQAKHIEWGPHM